MTYILPWKMVHQETKRDEPAICLPGCSICCSATNGESGIGLSKSDYASLVLYNSRTNPEKKVKIANIGAGLREKYYAEIPSRIVPSVQALDDLAAMETLQLKIGNNLHPCTHAVKPDYEALRALVDYSSMKLAKYGIEIKVDDSDLHRINTDSYKLCEVYESPRSSQCERNCIYATVYIPRILKAAQSKGLGSEFYKSLLFAASLKERIEKVSHLYPRMANIEKELRKL
jgi:hypothetical protein